MKSERAVHCIELAHADAVRRQAESDIAESGEHVLAPVLVVALRHLTAVGHAVEAGIAVVGEFLHQRVEILPLLCPLENVPSKLPRLLLAALDHPAGQLAGERDEDMLHHHAFRLGSARTALARASAGRQRQGPGEAEGDYGT